KIATPVRYIVQNGMFHLDHRWNPGQIPDTNNGQTTCGSLIVMGNWILGASNSVPAEGPLTVFAVSQRHPQTILHPQPYKNDPPDPELAPVFKPDISWADMSLEADPQNGLFYGVETLARKVAAFKIGVSNGKPAIVPVWEKTDTTTEWATL